MSLYGALFSGVSGLAAQSSAMGAISDNISNVNTIGYKGSKVNFQTLVTRQVSQTNYSPGGVQSKPRAGVDVQGLLQASNSSTDVALSGQGFFVVNEAAHPADGDQFAYTRAGSFKVDKEGFLQNVSGWYMEGWPLMNWDGSRQASTVQVGNSTMMKSYKDTSGNVKYINDNIVSAEHLQPLNLNTIGGTAASTGNLRIGANLPNGANIGKIIKQPVTIYDSLGGDSTVLLNWSKTAQNSWDVEGVPPLGAKSITLRNDSNQIYQTMGRLDFNGLSTTTGDVTFQIHGQDWNLKTKAGTSGQIANTIYANPNAVSGSVGTFVGNVAKQIDKAMRIEMEGHTEALTPSGAISATAGHGTSITVTNPATGETSTFSFSTTSDIDDGTAQSQVTEASTQFLTDLGINVSVAYDNTTGVLQVTNNDAATDLDIQGTGDAYTLTGSLDHATSQSTPAIQVFAASSSVNFDSTTPATTIDLTGMTMAEAVYQINEKTTTTGVAAMQNGGSLELYTEMAQTINVTGTGGDVAALAATLSGTGRAYCEQLSGTNSLVFRQFDDTGASGTLGVTGLDTLDLADGNPATMQGMDPLSSDTITLSAIDVVDSVNSKSGLAASGIEFNGDGTPKTINLSKMEVDWANGSKDMSISGATNDTVPSINLFLGNLNVRDGMSQLNGEYQLNYWTQDGAKFGNFSGVSIGTDGIVTALFDNGVTRPVFQIPVATFVNPNGMESLTGNTFIGTDFSGEPTLRTAGSAGAGQLNAASLEASTVDIGEEFTTMIVTQRAYSAAAKIITTADQMLDELVQIKR